MEKKKPHGIAEELEADYNYLALLRRILKKKFPVTEKRQEILAHCEEQSVNESDVWLDLALYREAGSNRVPGKKELFTLFDVKDRKLKERIPDLIRKLPSQTLSDFRELVIFTDRFRDRIEFLCDALLYIFLEHEKGSYRESADTHRYTEYFSNKLFREGDVLNDCAKAGIKGMNDRYLGWLCDKIMDEEVLI